VKAIDSCAVWQRGADACPAGAVVTGAVVAGVLAAADGTAVVLEPGERVAPGPGVVPWLAHPAASATMHAAATSAAAERVVIIVSP
jgi:hypothetical protein